MVSEQRLSVTFGAFSCDVVGYDDPFSILNRVIELFSEIAKTNPAFGAGEVGMSDMERAKLAAGLTDQASRIEELADQSAPGGMRYVVTNTEADVLEAPVADDIVEETVETAEDDVVIAAEADDSVASGDLELRDTLEAIDAPALLPEDEVVALDIDSVTSAETTSEVAETPEANASTSDEVLPEEPIIAETTSEVAEAPVASDELETTEINVVIEDPTTETPTETDAPEPIAAEVTSSPEEFKEFGEVVARLTENKPLRLNMKGNGVEAAQGNAPADAPQAETEDTASEAEPQKKPRRVTVTKLPLRPETTKTPESKAPEPKHILSQVHKVEPVVTLNPTIAAQSEEDAKPSRAERLKARMDKRDAEDDGDNFLFSDDPEAQTEETSEENFMQDENQAPLELGIVSSEAPDEANSQEANEQKPRRSLANLLGFGKKSADETDPVVEELEPTVEAPALELKPEAAKQKVETSDEVATSADGFDRLRESVAAALPTTSEPSVKLPQTAEVPQSISEAIDYDDETSPTAFARRVGATTLQDLLEVSAVYMDIVEGKSRFSRRDVMQALHQIDSDSDYSQEARLKSFRKLLTTGSLVRVDDGLFTVSQATRFGYESQLQAS